MSSFPPEDDNPYRSPESLPELKKSSRMSSMIPGTLIVVGGSTFLLGAALTIGAEYCPPIDRIRYAIGRGPVALATLTGIAAQITGTIAYLFSAPRNDR